MMSIAYDYSREVTPPVSAAEIKDTDLTAEELTDALADHFQGQAVTAEPLV